MAPNENDICLEQQFQNQLSCYAIWADSIPSFAYTLTTSSSVLAVAAAAVRGSGGLASKQIVAANQLNTVHNSSSVANWLKPHST